VGVLSLNSAISQLNKVIDEITEGKEAIAAQVMQKVSLDILADTVKNTRWDTGAMRGNWQVSRNLRNRSTLEAEDKAGNETISKGQIQLSLLRDGDTVFIQNNLPYTREWEEKDRMLENAVRKITKDIKL